MKKIFSNNRLIAIAFLTVFSVSVSAAAPGPNNKAGVPVELKFVGHIKNHPVFQLNFRGNPAQDEFTIIINDEYGNSLFWENIKGENFSKKFLLNMDEIGENMVFRFEIFCKKTKQSVKYEVNSTTRFVQEMAITEVK